MSEYCPHHVGRKKTKKPVGKYSDERVANMAESVAAKKEEMEKHDKEKGPSITAEDVEDWT